MQIIADINASDLDCYDYNDVLELYQGLFESEQINFLKQVFKKDNANSIIKKLFYALQQDEQSEILKELESNFISDEKARQSLEYLRLNA